MSPDPGADVAADPDVSATHLDAVLNLAKWLHRLRAVYDLDDTEQKGSNA